jgi:hypothetical protein
LYCNEIHFYQPISNSFFATCWKIPEKYPHIFGCISENPSAKISEFYQKLSDYFPKVLNNPKNKYTFPVPITPREKTNILPKTQI